MDISAIQALIRDVPDFPKPGILFKDITPVLQNGEAFAAVTEHFRARYADAGITKIAAPESRGFIFGAPLANALGAGLVLVRKPGKLPWKRVSETYELEYGTDTLEVHEDAFVEGDKVLLVDDLLATGGTAEAAIKLVQKCGGTVHEACFLIELAFLKGSEKLAPTPVYSVITY